MSRVHLVFGVTGEVVKYELRADSSRRRESLSQAHHHDDDLELAGLCGLAWERREGADFRTAIDAIADWYDRRQIRAWERRQRSRAALSQLLRETDPARSRRRSS